MNDFRRSFSFGAVCRFVGRLVTISSFELSGERAVRERTRRYHMLLTAKHPFRQSCFEWNLFLRLDDRCRIENVELVVVFGSLDCLNELESEFASPMVEVLLDRIPTSDRRVATSASVVRAVLQLEFRDETLFHDRAVPTFTPRHCR